jgi:hypothetical protein
MYMKYSYLACGPRVKCGSCGKIEWSQVKQSSDAGINWVPYSWRRTEPIPASWSLHCGGSCSNKNTLTTTVFEKLENPFFRNITEKNRERYEYNRKQVTSWLLAGWPETEERIRTNSLIYVSKGSIKEFAQLVLEVVKEDTTKFQDKAPRLARLGLEARLGRGRPETATAVTGCLSRQPGGQTGSNLGTRWSAVPSHG